MTLNTDEVRAKNREKERERDRVDTGNKQKTVIQLPILEGMLIQETQIV